MRNKVRTISIPRGIRWLQSLTRKEFDRNIAEMKARLGTQTPSYLASKATARGHLHRIGATAKPSRGKLSGHEYIVRRRAIARQSKIKTSGG